MNNTAMSGNTSSTNTTRPGNSSLKDHFKYLHFIFGVFESCLTPVIITANIFVIILILSSPKLRQRFSFLVIFSICVSESITGLLSCPVRASVLLGKNYSHGCGTYIVIALYEEFVQNFVASWGMVSLNTDYLLTMFNARLPKLSGVQRRLVQGTIVILPWVIMCAVVIPLVYTNYLTIYTSYLYCRINLPYNFRVLITHLTYVVPSIVMALQVMVMTITYIARKRRGRPMSELPSPVMCTLASMVVVLLTSLLRVLLMVGYKKGMAIGLKQYLSLAYSSVLVADSTGAVLPFIWFLSADIRSSCLDLYLYNKLPWRRSFGTSTRDVAVTYKNFE